MYRVGDQVKVVGFYYGAGDVSLGDVGVVNRVREGGKSFIVDFPKQKEWLAKEEDLEPVDTFGCFTNGTCVVYEHPKKLSVKYFKDMKEICKLSHPPEVVEAWWKYHLGDNL
jgi:hypothetical protein